MPDICRFLQENVSVISKFGNNVFATPNIPVKKVNGAINGHRFSGSPDSVIAIYDCTLLGGGEDGLLFTSTHVSFREPFSAPNMVAYYDIAAIEFLPRLIGGAIKLSLKDGRYVLSENLNCDYKRLAELLRSCAEYVGKYKESRPLAPIKVIGVAKMETVPTEVAQDEGVSVGAILAGAVVGVLAVAAAPFTGGGSVLGAATLAGSLAGAGGLAAAAGVAGAAAGAGLANQQRKQVAESSFRLAQERVVAEYATKTAALQEALSKAAQRFQEHNEFNNFVLCLIAVGASMAACDGNVHLEEQSQLREFALGIVSTKLPPTIEKAVSSLMACPPPFEQAMMYVERLGPDVWPHIDAVLAVVSEADGVLTQEEKDFLVKWAEYKLEHKQGEAV